MNSKWLGLLVAAGMFASPSYADDAFELETSANLGFMSKYVWRGWEVNEDPSGYAGFDLGYGNFYAGIWGGTDGTLGTEIDLYAGYAAEFEDYFSYDIGVIQYRYPGADTHVEEWHITLDFDVVSATYHKGEDDYDYIELNTTFDLAEDFTLDLHYGREERGVWTWNDYGVTLNYQVNDNYRVYLSATSKEDREDFLFFGIHADFQGIVFEAQIMAVLNAIVKVVGLVTAVSLLTGCIATGIRVGPVFIPVDTGIGKNKKPPKTARGEQPSGQSSEVNECEDAEVNTKTNDEQQKRKNDKSAKNTKCDDELVEEDEDKEIHF